MREGGIGESQGAIWPVRRDKLSLEGKVERTRERGKEFGYLVNTVVASNVSVTLDPSDLNRVGRFGAGEGAANRGGQVSIGPRSLTRLEKVQRQLTVSENNDLAGVGQGAEFLEAKAQGNQFANVVGAIPDGGSSVVGALGEGITYEDAGPTWAGVRGGRTIRVANDGVARDSR